MSTDQFTAEINSILRRVEEAAYKRGYEKGKSDKAAEIMNVLNAPARRGDDMTDNRSVSGLASFPDAKSDRPASERQRAPKGIVPKFVKRVLGSVSYGLSPQEMRAYAEDDFERMIKPASIRSELRNGKKAGRYVDREGKWFLVSSEAEGQSGQDNPSASDGNNGGIPNAAALDS